MKLHEWVWVILAVFFIVQGVAASYIIRSILKLRRSQHRMANYVQVLGGQLQKRGLVDVPPAADTGGGGGESTNGAAR